MDVFNRNGKILVGKFSSNVNGPEFDVIPYMTLCALDNISGEYRVSRLLKRKLKIRSFLDTTHNDKNTSKAIILFRAVQSVFGLSENFLKPRSKCSPAKILSTK